MIYFALISVGYFLGVFTALLAFPPQMKEIEEQERDALAPILELEREKENVGKEILGQPLVTSS